MNTKTAKKEFRKNKRNNYRNKLIKQNVNKIKRKLQHISPEELTPEGKMKIQKDYSNYVSIMHKISKKRNLIHPKTASRLISRISKKIKPLIS